MQNKKVLALIIAVSVVVIGALAGWSYFRASRITRPAPGRTDLVLPVGGTLPYLTPQPFTPAEFLWSLAGTIQKIDFQNKFFDLKLVPFYLTSFAPQDFTDTYRVYFDDSLGYRHIVIEMENGVGVKFNNLADFPLSQLGPGKPVRVLINFRDDGKIFGKTIYIFDFVKK